MLALGGCGEFSWPYHRDTTATIPVSPSGADAVAAECDSIRTEIRANQETRREAPTTTTVSDIVDAAQAKADQRIEELQQRADALDCPSEPSGPPIRTPPLQRAPGGGQP